MASPTGGYGGEGGMSRGSRSTSQPLTAREIKTKGGGGIILESDIEDIEKKLEISITRPVSPFVLTYNDILNIAKDPIVSTRTTKFRMNCILEKIPAPYVNRVLGLGTIPKNIINKEQVLIYSDDAGEIEYPSNYINDIGASISLVAIGDMGAKYNLIVKDITNTKWYNWNTEQFEHGYNSKEGIIDHASIQLVIPPQSSETKYHIFFSKKKCGLTDYGYGMPTEENPWTICQLMKATTIFSFDSSDDRFIPETTVSKTYNPGTLINARSEDGVKTDFTITVLPKRGQIKLSDEELERTKINSGSFNPPSSGIDKTSIFGVDLIASVNSSYSIGTITGTITLHTSSIRDYNFNINPSNFFKIT